MELFSSADIDEIINFKLSKDQNFKIHSTFGNPEKFLVLVTHFVNSLSVAFLKI